MRTVLLLAVLAVSTACSSTLDEFRDAAPSSQGISVQMRPMKGQALVGDPALMPGVTGATAFVVNGTVGLTLGTIASVVATHPAQVSEDSVTWGPVTRPLWANEFKMTMTRGAGGFDYVVWGRSKRDPSGPFVQFMTGHHTPGFSQASGQFVMDWTAMQALADPPRTVGQGEVSYTRNSRGDLTLDIRFLQTGKPEEATRTDSRYGFAQVEGGDGFLEYVIDTNYATMSSALERLAIKSRWRWDGSGRADAVGSGGDLAAPFRFTECWDTAHDRTHYGDTLGLFPPEGDASACAFQDAAYSGL